SATCAPGSLCRTKMPNTCKKKNPAEIAGRITHPQACLPECGDLVIVEDPITHHRLANQAFGFEMITGGNLKAVVAFLDQPVEHAPQSAKQRVRHTGGVFLDLADQHLDVAPADVDHRPVPPPRDKDPPHLQLAI